MTGLMSAPAAVGDTAAAATRFTVVGVAALPFLSAWTRSSADAEPSVLDEYGMADSISHYRSSTRNG